MGRIKYTMIRLFVISIFIRIWTKLGNLGLEAAVTLSNMTLTEECYAVTENKNPRGPLVPCSFLDTRFVECLRLISKNQTKVGS